MKCITMFKFIWFCYPICISVWWGLSVIGWLYLNNLSQIRHVVESFIHPYYSPSEQSCDVGLVKLNQSLEYNGRVQVSDCVILLDEQRNEKNQDAFIKIHPSCWNSL